jgi:MFS transporter, FSR family, fosmidomycin resistance protein
MIRVRAGLHPTILRLASTHFLVDGFGNIYPPLLPLLIPALQLSLAGAGVLQMCFQLANAVAQLGFGAIADRWRPRVLLIAGPIVCVSALSLLGLASNTWMLAGVLIVGGLGGAAFHPPAAALVHRFAGARTGYAMAFHITAGAIGQALAPLLFAPAAARWGLHVTPLLMLPAIALCVRFARGIPPLDRLHDRAEAGGLAALRPYRTPLTLLYLIVVLRTVTSLSFVTFMTVMLTRHGMPVGEAGIAAAVYLFASSIGGFIGGPLADAWGGRRIILLSLIGAVPFLMAAPFFSGWTFVSFVSTGGFLLQSSLPVNVTFGQTIAPISAATVSSLMMGFAWGMGGFIVPLVGLMADRIGIERTLVLIACVPLAAACLAVPLPAGKFARSARYASTVASAETTGTDVAP